MGPSGRPTTPSTSSTKQKRTTNTPTEDQATSCSPAPSPARHQSTAPPARGRGLSESSDSSSSGSDSDSSSNGEDTACPLNAAMEANTADTFSMPGDVSDLFLPGKIQLTDLLLLMAPNSRIFFSLFSVPE